MSKPVLSRLQSLHQQHRKSLAVLFDPDDSAEDMTEVLETALLHGVELFFVGGSLLTRGRTEACVELLKNGGAPVVVLFPGNEIQVVKGADAILFMSLISGRNPELLIGKQVIAAPWVQAAGLEAIPTGYMLIDSGRLTSAAYMSHTLPLPADKPDIAAATALAGALMGQAVTYLDAGSGAQSPIPAALIQRVRHTANTVLIAGGGIRTATEAAGAWEAGADIVVVGNGAFAKPDVIREIAAVLQKVNTVPVVV